MITASLQRAFPPPPDRSSPRICDPRLSNIDELGGSTSHMLWLGNSRGALK